MKKKINQKWISPHPKGWKIQSAGTTKPVKVVKNKAEALDFGTRFAKSNNSELVIQKKNGQIQNSNSFGKDPNPPRDTK